ncbi:MAG TPA: hypothetical protein VL625_08165 [Patescibacteria group bacterium]|nr:hypothetical protein [Patescibacteria group bacterium]
MKKFAWLVVALVALWPATSRAAGSAEITLIPTRIVMEPTDRYGTVEVKNTGQATGNFTTDLVDMKMTDKGLVVPLDAGEKDEFSAQAYLHMAPRSFSLKPGETQAVRLLLRKPEGMAAGEYRTHLQVRLANDNVDAAPPTKEHAAGIAVKTNIVLVIPVIVRHGETHYTMKIEDAKLTHDAQGKPVLDLNLSREGNRSSMGDITVTYTGPGGTATVLKKYPGVPVYRPTPKRFVEVPLDVPAGVSLNGGVLDITYNAQEKEGGKLLAEAKLPLGR